MDHGVGGARMGPGTQLEATGVIRDMAGVMGYAKEYFSCRWWEAFEGF